MPYTNQFDETADDVQSITAGPGYESTNLLPMRSPRTLYQITRSSNTGIVMHIQVKPRTREDHTPATPSWMESRPIMDSLPPWERQLFCNVRFQTIQTLLYNYGRQSHHSLLGRRRERMQRIVRYRDRI